MNDLQRIALAYAPSKCREALSALWALDAALGRVVATTTEPLIGQMRLTWWHERLIALDAGEVPAEPVIAALADVVQNYDVTGQALAGLVDGWETLLEPLPLGDDDLRNFATKRGDRLFALSAMILGSTVGNGLGAGWALIDFAAHCSDPITRERAWSLFKAMPIRAPKPLRILARIARGKALQPIDQIMLPPARWAVLRAVLL
jgi:15-cis-phytoene synthase